MKSGGSQTSDKRDVKTCAASNRFKLNIPVLDLKGETDWNMEGKRYKTSPQPK